MSTEEEVIKMLEKVIADAMAYVDWLIRKRKNPRLQELPPPFPVVPPEAMQSTFSKSRLTEFCLGIKEYEGWALPGQSLNGVKYPNGSPSYRNNNPGNCRFSRVGYHPMYGEVKKSESGFAIFKDEATGFLYLQNLIKSKVKDNPNATIRSLMAKYAPVEDDNDPERYAQFLAKKLGVSPDYLVKNLL